MKTLLSEETRSITGGETTLATAAAVAGIAAATVVTYCTFELWFTSNGPCGDAIATVTAAALK